MSDTIDTSDAFFRIALKGGGEVVVDPAQITDMDVYKSIFAEGLKSIINRVGMSKIAAGVTKLEGTAKESALKAIAERAEKTVQEMYSGELKSGKSKSKRSGAVQTEAMRLAKALVKQTLRDNGYKISAFDAKEITAYAKDVLSANPNLYKTAEENLAARNALPVKGLDVGKMLGDRTGDDSLKAKPKVPPKAKPKKEEILSAAQAGKVAPRAKPNPAQHGHTAH